MTTLTQLRAHGVLIALTTSFSRSTQDTILDALGWRDLIDLALTPTSELRGAHTSDQLRAAGATHILPSIADLPGLL